MKKTMLAIAAFVFSLTLAAQAQAQPAIGQAAPAFTAQAASGETIMLADLKGKIVVLEWTNADCPFVRKHYESGNMQALQSEFTAKGVVWLQVISSGAGKQGHVDAAGAQKANADRKATPTDTLLDADGVIGRAYLAKTTPHMFVINEDGVLAYMGAIDDNNSPSPEAVKGAHNYVRAALDSLLADKPVALPSTKSYGCSVKYAE